MEPLRFKLDEEWYDLPEGMAAFGELREWVLSHLKESGRVLLGVMSGEASLTVEDVEAWKGRPIKEMDMLEFFSAEPMALACSTCGELIEFLDELDRRGERTALSADSGESENIALGFKGYIEGWDIVLEGYRSLIQLADMDPATLEIGGRPVPVVAAELKGLILKMADEFGRGDMESFKGRLREEMVLYTPPVREALERIQVKLEEAAV